MVTNEHPIMRHIYRLAVEIGPRGSATRAERKAAEYVAEELRGMGLEGNLQPIRAIPTFSWPYMILYLWPWLALAVTLVQPLAGGILALVGAILFFAELNTYELVAAVLPKSEGYNVVGRRARPEAGQRVVIMSHLDSSKAALNFSPKMVPGFRSSFIMMVIAVVLSGLLIFAYGLSDWAPLRWASLVPAGYLLITVGFLVHREFWSRYTHGANDNASGVGVMLALAERAARGDEELEGLDLWFLAVSSEETSSAGVEGFLRQYGGEMKDALFINLDNIGAGRVHFMAGEGMFPTYKADRRLLALCQKVQKQRPDLDVRQGVYTLMTTDCTRILIKGYRGIGFLAVDERGLLPNWHWVTDTYENVDPKTVETALEFVWAMLEELNQADPGVTDRAVP
ncbi:MAG: M28 family peptidase [Bacillota bacterium]